MNRVVKIVHLPVSLYDWLTLLSCNFLKDCNLNPNRFNGLKPHLVSSYVLCHITLDDADTISQGPVFFTTHIIVPISTEHTVPCSFSQF